MNFNEYQELALKTCGVPPDDLFRNRLNMCALGIGGESGEFLDIIKKFLFHGHEIDKLKSAKELGDLLWYISIAADTLGFSLEEIAIQNIEKLKKRYPFGFSTEASINRKE